MLLAKQGVDVNQAKNNGSTPLYIASRNGHTELVKLLLAAPGIDVNQAANDGWTPLWSASVNGHTEIVELLKAAMPAPPFVDAVRNFTRLKEFKQAIQAAKSKGADINEKDVDGHAALEVALRSGNTQAVVELLTVENIGTTFDLKTTSKFTFPVKTFRAHETSMMTQQDVIQCPIRLLPCGHIFEASALSWIRSNGCPNRCRRVTRINLMSQAAVKRSNQLEAARKRADASAEKARREIESEKQSASYQRAILEEEELARQQEQLRVRAEQVRIRREKLLARHRAKLENANKRATANATQNRTLKMFENLKLNF